MTTWMTAEWTLVIVSAVLALATVVLALATIVLAWATHHIAKTAEATMRTDIFDKRYAIYESAKIFLGSVLRKGTVEIDALEEFRRGNLGSWFLFGKEVVEVLNQIWNAGCAIRTYEDKRNGKTFSSQDEFKKETDENHKLVVSLALSQGELHKQVEAVFAPYLDLRKP